MYLPSECDDVKSDLTSGIILAELAITGANFGDSEHEKRLQQKAKKAYAEFLRRWPTVEAHLTIADRQEINTKRAELEELIMSF